MRCCQWCCWGSFSGSIFSIIRGQLGPVSDRARRGLVRRPATAGKAPQELRGYQWHDAAQLTAASSDPEARERARPELADVLVYCLCLSNALEIDVSQAVRDKLALAGHKYPADEYQGRARRPGQA